MQNTLRSAVSITGIGLHTGRPIQMKVRPASANYGIWFRRTDVVGADAMVPAIWSAVAPSHLCTKVENDAGISVSTIEHLMAAFAGCGIHNALIEISGPEVPILDGSAEPFVAAFLSRGLISQATRARTVRILKPVEVREGASLARLDPAEMLEIDFHIDFEDKCIGSQQRALKMVNGAFIRELSDSRTFCLQSDVDIMHAKGLARGGTLENAVVFDNGKILSPGGLRHPDEPVRHKMLDAIGDLALAGGVILGRYTGIRAGHALTNRLLRALFADPTTFRIEDSVSDTLLPGIGPHGSILPTRHIAA